MKRSVFIVTEIILAAVFAASAVSIAAIASDIKNSAATQKTHSENPIQSSVEIQIEPPKEVSEASNTETSKQEGTSQDLETSQQIQFKEPENLSSQPDDLTDFITNYGYSYDYMSFDHLIVVDTKGNQATVYCYQKSDNGYWWNIMGDKKEITDKAFIGEGGANFVLTQGSKETPMGFYMLGDGFYIDSKPNTDYNMFRITEDTYWVDDPKSSFYNQKVEGTDKKDWESAEHMISSKNAYKYGIVIEYNTDPIIPEAGSAIFLQCGTSPTSGSISLPQDTMKTILEWLDKDSSAYIFIV